MLFTFVSQALAGDIKGDAGFLKFDINLGAVVAAVGAFCCLGAGLALCYLGRNKKDATSSAVTGRTKLGSLKIVSKSVGVILVAFGVILLLACIVLPIWLRAE